MNQAAEPMARSPFAPDSSFGGSRHIPILPSSTTSTNFSQTDVMDITPPASASIAPPNTSSPEAESEGQKSKGGSQHLTLNGTQGDSGASSGANGATLSAAAAASGQQPKVVQTAFIHKLYNMLEDQNIRHLISWSASNESFVMSPSPEFSKVLAQYFKHTNISSFVRQLNMYGFHKVSDVFHTGQPDSALWEFKHGNGNFKRGDLAGLREIKRRASRHALIHRESFTSPSHKPSVSQPGTPAEPAGAAEQTGDPRLTNIEHSLYEIHARLMRTEESNTALSTKCAVLSDSLARCQQWNNELTQIVMKMIPDHETQIYRDLSTIQQDMKRIAEMYQRQDDGHDGLLTGRPYFSNLAIDNVQLSPRQMAQDERRTSFQALPPKPGFFRTPAPPHLSISPRRFGSIGNNTHSPSYRTTANAGQPAQPPTQHPLASVSEPGVNLGRRHTSADIRDTPGWPPQGPGQLGVSPFEPSTASTAASNWPPSPQINTPTQGDQHLQSVLASYTLGAPRRQPNSGVPSRGGSPPPPDAPAPPLSGSGSGGGAGGLALGPGENGFTFKSPNYGPRFVDHSAPQTRRSSMASNVHNLLNPAESGERERDDEEGNEDRKRKRI